MRYGFINNFETTLAAELAAGATTMEISEGGADLSGASADLVYTLTLFDVTSGATEIVYVTGATSNTLTVERGKEGTTDAAWPSGSQVEMRVTAEAVNAFWASSGLTSGGALGALGTGSNASADGAVAIGPDSTASGLRSVAVMAGTAAGEDAMAIGPASSVYAARGIAIFGEVYGADSIALMGGYTGGAGSFSAGAGSNAAGDNAIALMGGSAGGDGSFAWGVGADAYASGAFAAGAGSSAGEGCSAIGPDSVAQYSASFGTGFAASKNAFAAPGTISIGEDAQSQAPAGQSWGKGASSLAPENVASGPWATAPTPYSVALGPYASTANVPGGFQLNALSYLRATPDDTGTYGGPAPSASRRASQQVVIATDPLDLTDDTDTVTLDLPQNTLLFIDTIDVVITGSDSPGGSPEITIGPDDVTPAAYLAATTLTKTAVGERETHSPLVTSGVTSLRVATSTAGTGTTYMAKVILRGYVMEL